MNRKNVMIKIPATKAGLPVIETLISEGINVNATLIFSIPRYMEVMEAYFWASKNAWRTTCQLIILPVWHLSLFPG